MDRVSILQFGDLHYDEYSSTKLDVDNKDNRPPVHLVDNIARPVGLVLGEHIGNRLRRGDRPLVAICGDLTSRGNGDTYKRAVEYLEGALCSDSFTSPTDAEIHIVPGNHDVDWKASMPYVDLSPDRLQPIADVIDGSRLASPLTLRARHTQVARGSSLVSLSSVNSCRATGSYRQAPELQIDDPVVAAIHSETGTPEADIREAIRQWAVRTEDTRHEALDIPLIESDDLRSIANAVSSVEDPAVHVILAHHGFLPQGTPRINPYSEMVNGGDVRQTLLNFRKPILYLHGHIHEDRVEILNSGGPNRPDSFDAPLIVIAAPEMARGYNEIVVEFGSYGRPLGISIKRYRIAGGIVHGERDERISLCGRTVTDVRFKPILQRLHENSMASGDQILRWARNEHGRDDTQSLTKPEIEECIETLCWQRVIESHSPRSDPFESRDYSFR